MEYFGSDERRPIDPLQLNRSLIPVSTNCKFQITYEIQPPSVPIGEPRNAFILSALSGWVHLILRQTYRLLALSNPYLRVPHSMRWDAISALEIHLQTRHYVAPGKSIMQRYADTYGKGKGFIGELRKGSRVSGGKS